jgi:hypothetical protein
MVKKWERDLTSPSPGVCDVNIYLLYAQEQPKILNVVTLSLNRTRPV